MKHIVGYGIKFSTESAQKAWAVYSLNGLFSSKKEAKNQIKEYKENDDINSDETVSIFKVTMETIK